MNDLQTRITEYVDSTVPPVDIDLLVEALNQDEEPTRRLRPEPADRKWWQHRRWVPVLAACHCGAPHGRWCRPAPRPERSTGDHHSGADAHVDDIAPGGGARALDPSRTAISRPASGRASLPGQSQPGVAGSLRSATRGPGVMSGDAARSGRRSTDHRGRGWPTTTGRCSKRAIGRREAPSPRPVSSHGVATTAREARSSGTPPTAWTGASCRPASRRSTVSPPPGFGPRLRRLPALRRSGTIASSSRTSAHP